MHMEKSRTLEQIASVKRVASIFVMHFKSFHSKSKKQIVNNLELLFIARLFVLLFILQVNMASIRISSNVVFRQFAVDFCYIYMVLLSSLSLIFLQRDFATKLTEMALILVGHSLPSEHFPSKTLKIIHFGKLLVTCHTDAQLDSFLFHLKDLTIYYIMLTFNCYTLSIIFFM